MLLAFAIFTAWYFQTQQDITPVGVGAGTSMHFTFDDQEGPMYLGERFTVIMCGGPVRVAGGRYNHRLDTFEYRGVP